MFVEILIGMACLALIEIIVRVVFPKPPAWLAPQVRIELSDRIGYQNRPNQKAFSGEQVATINSLGLRGPEIELERKPNSLRILGLGNSLTFGGGVADDETYLAYLEQHLDREWPARLNEVLNAAIYGFTIRQYVPFLESMLGKLQPDIVLIGVHWRDLHFHPRFGQLKKKVDGETWRMIQKKFKERIDKGDAEPTAKERYLMRIKNALRHWRSLYVARHYLMALKNTIKPPNFLLWQRAFLSGEATEPIRRRRIEAKKTLREMQRMCNDSGIKFAVVVFPDYKQIKKDYPRSSWPAALIEICEELQIPNLYLLPAIRRGRKKYGPSLLLPYDVTHYSAAGNREIANALFEFLRKEKILPEHKQSAVVAA